MGGKSSPKPVNYEAAAIAEGEAAKEVTAQQTWANRPIQQNPWGTINWDTQQIIDPGTGKPVTQWKQTQTLADPLNEALWAQMNLQNMRSQLGAGMMGALQGQYFTTDENGNMVYNAPQWAGAGGMMMPGEPINVTDQNVPDRWGHLQWDLPSYQTEGAVRQLDYGNLPGISDPLSAMQNLYGVEDPSSMYGQLPGLTDTRGMLGALGGITQDTTGMYGQLPGVMQTTGMYGNLYNVNAPQYSINRAEQAHYDRSMGRIQQQFDSERQAMEIKMRNQGLAPGDEAWDSQMMSFNQKYNDAVQNAQNEAIMQGGREAERLYGMEMGLRQQGASEIGQHFGEQMGLRQMGLGEIGQRFGEQMGLRQQGQSEIGQMSAEELARRQQYVDEIGARYGQQMGLRGQGWDELQGAIGMQQGIRGQYAGELLDLGNFANAAAQQDFLQSLQAGAQGFQDVRQAAEFQNQARQQALQERMALMGFNTDQAYRYSDYYNKARQQQINEYMTQRGFTLNEIQALLNNQQVGMPQFNQFTQATKSDTAPILQGAYMQGQWNTAQANADNAFMNNLLGGASSLAGIAGMFSDRRLKSNIRKIGERKGVNWYSYEIFGRPQIGVMADEVPWAAVQHPSGYMMVDYRKL